MLLGYTVAAGGPAKDIPRQDDESASPYASIGVSSRLPHSPKEPS